MRLYALLLIAAAACDHRPPAKQQPAPTPPTPVAVTTHDAGSAAVAPPPGDDACLQIGVKLAEIIINATTDATQKAAYEQERTKLVKRFSDNCAREQWPEKVRTCFLAAKSPSEVEVCSRDLVKPAPAPPPGAGSGSGSAGSAGSAAVDPHAGHAH